MPTRRALLRSTLLSVPALACSARAAGAGAEYTDGDWSDASRQRTLPWRLRLPAGSAPCPLVLYSHGLGGSRAGAEAWGRAWADAGIAVLHVQHAGSDVEVLRSGGGAALLAAASAGQLLERLRDLRFALDEVLRRAAAGETPWQQRIRGDAIGVAGHSFGALTTQAMAGQRYPGVGDLSDPRPRAFVALNPSLPQRAAMTPADAFAGVVRPFFALTGSLDASPVQRLRADAQRAAVYDALPPGQRALLWLDGADHASFGGTRGDPHSRHARLIAAATGAWWQWRLLGDDTARGRLDSLPGLTDADRLRIG